MSNVIFQDENLVVVNKPAGILTHDPGYKKQTAQKSLNKELLVKYPEIKGVGDDPDRPGIVHRLDKDTSGVMLIARSQKSFEYLKSLFQAGKIKKTYIALVYGKMKTRRGVINKPISLKTSTIKRTVHKGRMTKEAATEYKVKKVFEKDGNYFTLLKVMPKTGRTHQIRVHLASIGHPVVGDRVYGGKKKFFEIRRQFLHAESLEFNLAEGKRIKIEAGLPEDLEAVILELKRNGAGNIQKN